MLPASTSLQPNATLAGRYRVIRLLGEGGMGAVYEAEHMMIGRRVALKMLHPKYCVQHEAVVRFTREARAAAAIGHENIVDVTDFGTHEGQPFLVMELLRGTTLDELMVNHDVFELPRAANIVGHVLSALAAAHAVGIVHRDLKPENLYLVEQNGRSVVKVLDFGISKFQAQSDNLHTTEEGAMLGTPSYMSPEQWLSVRDIDHRADLFAVGVLLYEMLTGCLPYEGVSRGELMLQVVTGTEPPEPASSINDALPTELDAVLAKAVARAREDRYQTAQEFLDALRPFGAHDISVTDAAPSSLAAANTSESLPDAVRLLTEAEGARPDARNVPTLTDERDVTPPPTLIPPPIWKSPTALLAAAGLIAAVTGMILLLRGPSRPTELVPPPRPVVRPAALVDAAVAAAPQRPAQVRITLQGAPPDASVTFDDRAVPGSEIVIDRDTREHTLVIAAAGAERRLAVRGDTDQVLLIEMPPPPRVVRAPGTTQGSRNGAPPHRGRRHGLDINRRF